MEEIKLYEYNYEKMSLDDALIHYGIKGMHWGIRKDGKPQGYQGSGKGRGRKKSKSSISRTQKKNEWKTKSKEDIIATRDLKAMSKRKSEFSNKEIQDVLNRINTERNLDKAYNDTKPFNKFLDLRESRSFKFIAGISVIALPLAIETYKFSKHISTPGVNVTDNMIKNMADMYKNDAKKIGKFIIGIGKKK